MEKNSEKGDVAMNPRVFISSTFYELKYAREGLGRFISGFGFEPIQSERSNIGYIPGEALDKSCYIAMQASDMAVLIVGGEYGSPASGEDAEKESFDRFISITHREFDTAVKNSIPVFVFIEGKVYDEYNIYKANKELLENSPKEFKFHATKSINVFRFIESIHLLPKIPVFPFNTIEEIEEILTNQWADMFRSYLSILRHSASTISEEDQAVSQIYSSLQEMNVMLHQMGETMLKTSEPGTWEEIQRKQRLEKAAGSVAETFEFISTLKETAAIRQYLSFFIEKLFEAKNDDLLEYPFSDNPDDIMCFYELFDYEGVRISAVKDHLAVHDELFGDVSSEFRKDLADRLAQPDYIKKMKLLKNP